jgi:hypothetical protein
MTLLPTDHLNGLGERLNLAYQNKEAIQDRVYRAANSKDVDDFPRILKASGAIDRWGHLDRWTKRDFGRSERGFGEHDTYFLFPLLILHKISYAELVRMLPLGRRHWATTRELVAFQIENRKAVLRLLLRQHYRIAALGTDDFDVSGSSAPFIQVVHSVLVLDRITAMTDEKWGPKDLFLFRYPRRS